MSAPPPVVLLLGPSRDAISGVSTHLNLLLGSALAREFDLVHVQVGGEGRTEGPLARLARLAASPFALASAIARHDAAIVHLNTSLNARAAWRDFLYLAVAKLFGARVVYQVHGGQLPRDFFGQGPLSRLARALLERPDVIVVLASCELEAYREFLPGQNVVMLPNAIDCALYSGFARAQAPQGPLRLLYIGRLAASKGLFQILDALALATQRGIATRLAVAGGGPEEQALRQRVRALGLEDVVSFAGPAFGEDKARLLREAEVLLLPTYHREGLPYALLEGMAAGLVPVVTRVGAIPDVVLEGTHGVFVPPRDAAALAEAIAALAADRARLAHMSAACRRRIAHAYSVEQLAAGFAALYRRLVAPWAASRAG